MAIVRGRAQREEDGVQAFVRGNQFAHQPGGQEMSPAVGPQISECGIAIVELFVFKLKPLTAGQVLSGEDRVSVVVVRLSKMSSSVDHWTDFLSIYSRK